jgi:hypothetical protein
VAWLIGEHPDDEDKRVIAPNKNNVAALPSSRAIRLVQPDEHDAIQIRWDGVVDITASDLVSRSGGRGRTPKKLSTARDWLRNQLADEPKKASTLIEQAEAEGISKRTLERAKEELPVESDKVGFDGPWQWELEDDSC